MCFESGLCHGYWLSRAPRPLTAACLPEEPAGTSAVVGGWGLATCKALTGNDLS